MAAIIASLLFVVFLISCACVTITGSFAFVLVAFLTGLAVTVVVLADEDTHA